MGGRGEAGAGHNSQALIFRSLSWKASRFPLTAWSGFGDCEFGDRVQTEDLTLTGWHHSVYLLEAHLTGWAETIKKGAPRKGPTAEEHGWKPVTSWKVIWELCERPLLQTCLRRGFSMTPLDKKWIQEHVWWQSFSLGIDYLIQGWVKIKKHSNLEREKKYCCRTGERKQLAGTS